MYMYNINMSIDIRAIKVMLDTNIPGQKTMPLKKSLLYNPELNTSSFEEYPYFTMDVPYPESYLITLPYQKQMEFSFVKTQMTKVLRIYNKDTLYTNVKDNSTFIKSEAEERKELSKMQEEKEKKQKKEVEKDIVSEMKLKKGIEIQELENKFIETFEGLDGNEVSILYEKGFFWIHNKKDKDEKLLLNVNNKKLPIDSIDSYMKIKDENIEDEVQKLKDVITSFETGTVLDILFKARNKEESLVPRTDKERVNTSYKGFSFDKCAGENVYMTQPVGKIFDNWKQELSEFKRIITTNINNKLYKDILSDLLDVIDELKKIECAKKYYKYKDKPELAEWSLISGKKRTAEKIDVSQEIQSDKKIYAYHICQLQIDIEKIMNDSTFKKVCKKVLQQLDVKKLQSAFNDAAIQLKQQIQNKQQK